MVAPANSCDRNRLRQLIDDQLPAEIQSDLVRHLDQCPVCRDQLEKLAAPERWWRATHDSLSGVDDAGGESRAQHSDSRSLDGATATVAPLRQARELGRERPSGAKDDNGGDKLGGELAGNDSSDIFMEESATALDFLQPSDNPAMLGRLGEFEIIEVIGRGGMGIVLKGYDRELNRYVAIKTLAPHLAGNAAARRRFAREAQAAAAVVHQHVVAIHAVDAGYKTPYLVMAHVPGESLDDRIVRTGPLPLADILRIGMQVAEGLAAAHAQGLVHRDIKPANILLERNVERVMLTDFGLARAVDDASLTHSGVIAGTPQYMSPEQARGEAIDHRADLFSLGSVLYAMCTGHAPFRAETTLGVLRRICESSPRSIREQNSEIPAWLETLIARLHAIDPAARYQSAEEVARLLRQCLAHVQQPTVEPLPADLRRWRFDDGARGWMLAMAASLVAALVVWQGATAMRGWFAATNPPTTNEHRAASEASDGAGKLRLDRPSLTARPGAERSTRASASVDPDAKTSRQTIPQINCAAELQSIDQELQEFELTLGLYPIKKDTDDDNTTIENR